MDNLEPYSKAWWVLMYHYAYLRESAGANRLRSTEGYEGADIANRYLTLRRWIKDRIED